MSCSGNSIEASERELYTICRVPYRKNGTDDFLVKRENMRAAVARYREFAPCEGLQNQIRAFFTFGPDGENDLGSERRITREVRFGRGDSFCSPLFADGHISLVVSLQRACYPEGSWRTLSTQPRADVIGAMSTVGAASLGERAEMIGIYFRAAPMPGLLPVPADELTDRV